MELKKVGAYAGMLAPAVFLVFLLLAVSNFSDYSITTNYLSDLGIGNSSVFFNSGLFVGGFLGLLFSISITSYFEKWARRGGKTFLIASLALIGIGIFTEDYPVIHFILTLTFFTLSAVSMIFVGVEIKDKTLGKVSILAGVVCFSFITGLYIMEHLAVAAIMIWSVLVGNYIRKRE